MATHSSVLAWRIPGTGEPGGLPSMGSHRVGHDGSDLAAAAAAAAEPIDSSTEPAQAEQLKGMEHSPTHQQKNGINELLRARPSFPHSHFLPTGTCTGLLSISRVRAKTMIRSENYNPTISKMKINHSRRKQ